MEVSFRRTGERRYAVVVRSAGSEARMMSPAPGFDEHIPHDLVHYVVEAELGLEAGVFGRAAGGGGGFWAVAGASSARQRGREERKRARRERSMARRPGSEEEMRTSERLAYHADIAWRRRHGQRPDPAREPAVEPLSSEDTARVARVVMRLEELAPRWRALPIDGELTFAWPGLTPK